MDIPHLLLSDKKMADAVSKIPADPDTAFPVLSAKIKLTWQCNLQCRMCSLWRTAKNNPDSETFSLNKAKDIIAELVCLGIRKIHFSGGEVFTLSYFTDLLQYTAQQGIQVNLTTNGTLISEDAARLMVEERIHTVVISIDSHKRKRHDLIRGKDGAFKAAWDGIARLRKRKQRKGRGPKIAVNTVISRDNIEQLDQLYDLLVSKGVDSWRLLPIDTDIKKNRPTQAQWQRLHDKLEQWSPLLARRPVDPSAVSLGSKAAKGQYSGAFYENNLCFAPWFNLFINADGNVYPCCMGRVDMVPYGNIHQAPLTQMMSGEKRRHICCTLASGHLFPACSRCDDFLAENRAFNVYVAKMGTGA